MKKDPFQGFGLLWSSRTLSLKDIKDTVVKILEVWHFPHMSDTLFTEYVKTFLKFKQEASGFPPQVVTDAKKQSYVKGYFEKEGIQLDIY